MSGRGTVVDRAQIPVRCFREQQFGRVGRRMGQCEKGLEYFSSQKKALSLSVPGIPRGWGGSSCSQTQRGQGTCPRLHSPPTSY